MRGLRSNALIGNNGSGKSNVLEALASAFAAVYNEQTIDFIYDICYRINNSKYQILTEVVRFSPRMEKM